MNTTHLLRSAAATLAFVIVLQTSVCVSYAEPPLEPQSSCTNVTRDFVRGNAPGNDRYLDFFRGCGSMESLELLMSGLAKTNGPRDPLELFAAIDATMNSPILKTTPRRQHCSPVPFQLFPTRAIAQSSAPFDDTVLFEVARNDKDAGVRKQKHGLPSSTSIGCMTGPIGLSLSMRRATASR